MKKVYLLAPLVWLAVVACTPERKTTQTQLFEQGCVLESRVKTGRVVCARCAPETLSTWQCPAQTKRIVE